LIEAFFEVSDLLSLMGELFALDTELFALDTELFALKQNQRTQLAHYFLGALRPGWIRLGEVGNLHEMSLQMANKIFGNLNRYPLPLSLSLLGDQRLYIGI
jgi:hypothetical protein